MKLTNIKILERKNLGDYQHRDVELSAVVGEDESDSDAVARVIRLVTWHVHAPERKAEYAKATATLADENANEAAKAKATRYIARYDEAKAEVEG